MSFSTKILEYDKVLEKVASFAHSSYTKEKILNLMPETDIDEVNRLLDLTKEGNKIFISYGDIPYTNYENVRSYINYANKGGVLESNNFLQILALLENCNNIKRFINNIEDIKHNLIDEYLKNLVDLPKLRTNINLAINSEGNILDSASKELFQIRRKISLANNKIRQTLTMIMQHESQKLNELLIVYRNNRLCLPVKIEYKNSIKGIIHDISSSNTTCYIEPEAVLALQNDLEILKEEEKKEIQTILANLSLLVLASYNELSTNLDTLTELDLVFAKAKYASDYMERPIITDSFSFNLENIKHPLIEREKCVPISVKMTEKDTTIIITGPNTGGKTVSLKTVGLSSMLVQSGIFVDCKAKSTFCIFKNILADIGDEQSILASLSTFSGHIKNIISILNEPLDNSLILFDELGSGTDPKEGSALAIAIIEKLREYKTKSIISTHYSDLKNLAYKTEGIINASVEFNLNTLKPTYKLLQGVPGQSNALIIASNLGLASDICEFSEKYLNDNYSSSKELKDYEQKLGELKSKEEEINLRLEEVSKLKEDLEIEKNNLELKRNTYLQKARKEADNIIYDAKVEAAKLLDEIKKVSQEAEIKAHELAALKHKANTLKVNSNDESIFNENFVVGDYVLIKSYNKNGYITKVKKNVYEVNFGPFTMDFKKEDLVKANKPKKEEKPKVKMSGYNSVNQATMSLDLRGKRYEEVKDLVEEFLDKAIIANYEQVSIIHGYGTGVVRNRVIELLKHNPNVKEYRFGKEGEGLMGCTVVKLK